jgi:hypothetical protein
MTKEKNKKVEEKVSGRDKKGRFVKGEYKGGPGRGKVAELDGGLDTILEDLVPVLKKDLKSKNAQWEKDHAKDRPVLDPRVYEALGVVLDRILGDDEEAEVVDGDDDDDDEAI